MSDVFNAASFISTHGTTTLHVEAFEDGSAVLIMRDRVNDTEQRMAISPGEFVTMANTFNAIKKD